ncbi:nucleolar protein dao-5 [Punica granatum]|uniref:Calmodulin-binding domain-containing protein n=2 Tax=Punica granatum TaxID=22663 RepID=A0A218WQ69_PUNGR|nr:nucleolar protein dao-5 [Punica granatum]OWM74786.1 hypothetical protein CDL15_Pgr004553 [Punica granatum]PKI38740.1 hypothetical protein CRG98_040853 [Punica granatum]
MAEENNNPPATPEPIKREKVNLRRYSMGPSSSSSSTPNYLRASTGSCHDFCKYGKAHSCEPKARNPFPKRLIKRPPEDEILVKSAVFPERIKKSPVNRPKSSSGAEIPVREASDIVKQKVLKAERRNSMRGDLQVEKKKTTPAVATKSSLNSSTLSLNARKPMKKDGFSTNETSKGVMPTDETSKRVMPTNEISKRDMPTNETSKGVLPANETPKRALPKPKERRLSGSIVTPVKSSPLILRRLSTSNDSSQLRLQKKGETKTRESPRTQKRVGTKNLNVFSSAPPPSKPSISKRITVKNVPRTIVGKKVTNGATSGKSEDEVKNVGVSNKEEIAEKTLYIVNVEETESKTSGAITSERIDVNMGEVSNKEEIVEKTLYIVNVEETESKTSEAITSESIDVNVVNVEETESKPLEVVPDETIAESNIENVEEIENRSSNESVAESISLPLGESPSLSPSDSPPLLQQDDQTESEYTMSESEEYSASDYEESNLMQGSGVSEEGDGKNQPRKGRHHLPEPEEGSKPTKLRFRRGRIIDVQHESNTPRRLRFRRGRLPGETKNLNPEPRRKKREQIEAVSNNDGSEEGSTKVILRHSDVQEKKDAKGLFNNVIEETASKLVETRKSKVKALVGAFETVISLQDTKPAANT